MPRFDKPPMLRSALSIQSEMSNRERVDEASGNSDCVAQVCRIPLAYGSNRGSSASSTSQVTESRISSQGGSEFKNARP